MNKIVLSQEEADSLLNILKKSLEEYLTLPTPGNNTELTVCSLVDRNEFKINIFQSRIANKINFGARISKNNIMLLELHINPTNIHPTPDGEKIVGNHWHIYKEGYETRWAFPATDINDENFVNLTLKYLKKFNVIETPHIDFKLDLGI